LETTTTLEDFVRRRFGFSEKWC